MAIKLEIIGDYSASASASIRQAVKDVQTLGRESSVVAQEISSNAAAERRALQELAAEFGAVARSAAKGSDEQVAAAKLAAQAQRQLAVQTRATAEASAVSIAGLKKEASGLTGVFSKLGSSTALWLGVPAAGAGIASAIHATQQYGASLEQLHTQAHASQVEVDRMRGSLLSLAPAVNTGPEVLTQGLFHLESQGLHSTKALGALTAAAEGARIGNANLEDVTNALGATIVSGIKGVNDYQQAMGTLNATVGAGDMHMQDLADAMGTGLAAKARLFGLSIQDVDAALAVLGDNNIRGAESGTLLASAIRLLGAPSKQSAKYLGDLGLSATQLGVDMRNGGIPTAIKDLVDHMNALGLSAAQQAREITLAFGGKQSGAIMILVDQYQRLLLKEREVAAGSHSFASDWASYQQQSQAATQRLGAELDVLRIEVGQQIIPAFTQATKGLAEWIDKENKSGAAAHDTKVLIEDLSSVVKTGAKIVGDIDKATGGFKNTLELLLALKVASKLSSWTGGLSTLIGKGSGAGGTGLLGAEGAAGGLQSKLGSLAKIGALSIGIDLLIREHGSKGAIAIVEGIAGGALVGGALGGAPGAVIGAAAAIPHAAGNSNPNAPSNLPAQKFASGLPLIGGLASQVGALADWIQGSAGLIPAAPVKGSGFTSNPAAGAFPGLTATPFPSTTTKTGSGNPFAGLPTVTGAGAAGGGGGGAGNPNFNGAGGGSTHTKKTPNASIPELWKHSLAVFDQNVTSVQLEHLKQAHADAISAIKAETGVKDKQAAIDEVNRQYQSASVKLIGVVKTRWGTALKDFGADVSSSQLDDLRKQEQDAIAAVRSSGATSAEKAAAVAAIRSQFGSAQSKLNTELAAAAKKTISSIEAEALGPAQTAKLDAAAGQPAAVILADQQSLATVYEHEATQLKAKLNDSTGRARTEFQTALSKIQSTVASTRDQVASTLQSIAQAAQGRLQTVLGSIQSAADQALGAQFYQGTLTPLEQQLQDMQQADQKQSLIDQLNADLQTQAQDALGTNGAAPGYAARDAKQVAADQRALQEFDLGIEAQRQRTQMDKDYAKAEFNLNQQLQDLTQKVGDGASIQGDLNTLLDTFHLKLSDLSDPGGNGLLAQLGSAVTDTKTAFGDLITWIGKTTVQTPMVVGTGSTTVQLPHFAAGGPTGGGSGAFAAMLHRREYVVPERGALVLRGGGGEGGGLVVNVNINGSVYGADSKRLARELAPDMRDELVKIGRREPTLFSGQGVTP